MGIVIFRGGFFYFKREGKGRMGGGFLWWGFGRKGRVNIGLDGE